MARLLRRILLGLVLLVVLVVGAVYALSERKLNARYTPPAEAALTIPTDSAAIDRGRHLFLVAAACAHCHGVNAEGGIDPAPNPVFLMSPPNLTRGKGGIIEARTPQQLEWAIRHGVRSDSTSLMIMPSDAYSHMSDSDVAALIAYLRQVTPVDHAPVPTGFGPMGRVLLVAGKMTVQVAPRTPVHPADPGPTVEQGRYLASIAGCHSCHNPALSGFQIPNEPFAPNITPTGIGSWSEADFALALREGKRPDGRILDKFMPWERFNGMTDEEVHLLWEYVRSFPAKETGVM
jgi:mono/diheme cytochrome c family protein